MSTADPSAVLDERAFRLDGRVALVTGGGGGIGGAICRLFANVGAAVGCIDHVQAQAAATVAAIEAAGGRAIAIGCDVADEAQVQAAAGRAIAELGAPTVLVNCAAAADRSGNILEIDLAEWERVHRVNLTGAFMMSRAVLPSMIASGGGSIIHVSSMYARVLLPGRAAYSSTKAALVQFAKAMALDHAEQGVRVNTLSPGPVETVRVTRKYEQMTPAEREKWLARVPMRRFGSTDEVAKAALFLASDASSYVTATDLLVDGGRCALA